LFLVATCIVAPPKCQAVTLQAIFFSWRLFISRLDSDSFGVFSTMHGCTLRRAPEYGSNRCEGSLYLNIIQNLRDEGAGEGVWSNARVCAGAAGGPLQTVGPQQHRGNGTVDVPRVLAHSAPTGLPSLPCPCVFLVQCLVSINLRYTYSFLPVTLAGPSRGSDGHNETR